MMGAGDLASGHAADELMAPSSPKYLMLHSSQMTALKAAQILSRAVLPVIFLGVETSLNA